jgi:hypothetical protein
MEHHIQFDIVEYDADLERYRLLVLPDSLAVDESLAQRLQTYLDNGGAIIASYDALRLEGSDRLWPRELPLNYAGESPFKPVYLKFGSSLAGTLPDYEFALYDGSAQWQSTGEQEHETLAQLVEPLFQRGPEHYTSHGQTPADHITDYVAVAHGGRLAATAFPIAASYYRHGYWIYRAIFGQVLERVLPVRLTVTNAPISTEVTVTHQVATASRPERWMVHVVNFSPNRRGAEHPDYVEDPIPLHNIQLDVALDAEIVRAYTAAGGAELTLRRDDARWSVVVPRIEISVIVVLETASR